MPVVRNYFATHQWVRELRRSGVRSYVGVYFRVRDDENVWAGRYNKEHLKVSISEAAAELDGLDDPLGFEVIVERSVTPKEIVRIKPIRQLIGWRYMPHAHLQKPTCGCPMCIPKGSIKNTALRERLEPSYKRLPFKIICKRLQEYADHLEGGSLSDALTDALRDLRKKRKDSPALLVPLLFDTSISDDYSIEDLICTLSFFRRAETLDLLETLIAEDPRPFVKGVAQYVRKKYLEGDSISSIDFDDFQILRSDAAQQAHAGNP